MHATSYNHAKKNRVNRRASHTLVYEEAHCLAFIHKNDPKSHRLGSQQSQSHPIISNQALFISVSVCLSMH